MPKTIIQRRTVNLGASKTDVYYSLLDFEAEQKQAYLKQLQQDNPALYAEVMPLVAAESSEKFTELLRVNLESTTESSLDYTNQQIDKYLITHELGRGGMGVVYAANRADQSFDQKLAIKFLHGDLAKVFDRNSLFSEAQMLAKLNHPHIAKVFDGGVYQEHVYIVMEQVEGDNLEVFQQQNSLSHQEKLLLLIQICNALEHTHAQGLIHGDLKPENILVDNSQHTKLIDFNLTQHPGHLLAFSKEYASPEQQAGETLSASSDVYSLGRLIEWLFSSSEAHPDLKAIVAKACHSQPKQRYRTVSHVRQDLHNILTCRPISLKKKNLLYRSTRLFQRHPISCSLALMLMVSGLAFTSALIAKNQQLEQEKLIAENMMFEVTSMMFHSKSPAAQEMPVSAVLDLTRRRILSNPNIPQHIKQKMLLAMMMPVDSKSAKHETNVSQKNK